jgi:hypothetical protein
MGFTACQAGGLPGWWEPRFTRRRPPKGWKLANMARKNKKLHAKIMRMPLFQPSKKKSLTSAGGIFENKELVGLRFVLSRFKSVLTTSRNPDFREEMDELFYRIFPVHPRNNRRQHGR